MGPSVKRFSREDEIDSTLFDIMAYLDDRGVHYSSSGSKNVSVGWIGIACPYCSDRSNHLGINLTSKRWSCFKCGKKGNPITLIMKIDDCGVGRAKATFEKFISSDFSYMERKERLHADKTKLPPNTSTKFLPIHDKFLESRRYDREFIERKYDIMAVGPTCDDWKFRIVIPVYQDGEMVTYVARDTTGNLEIPYKNAPIEHSIIQAKHCLYNFDSIKDGVGVAVEGCLDVWRCGNNFFCTFGTQFTPAQLVRMRSLRKIFILFDSDASSKAEALAYQATSVVPSVEIIYLNQGDPDNLTEDEVWDLRRDIF